MSTNIIDAFELKTVEVQVDKNLTDKVSAFCYGDLGTYRVDNFVRRHNGDGPLAAIELWGILVLSNGCLFPTSPVFKTLDNAANFIYGASLLCNSWARADRDAYARHIQTLASLMEQYDGYPLVLMLRHLPGFKDTTEEPGTRMNLNGYTPDPT